MNSQVVGWEPTQHRVVFLAGFVLGATRNERGQIISKATPGNESTLPTIVIVRTRNRTGSVVQSKTIAQFGISFLWTELLLVGVERCFLQLCLIGSPSVPGSNRGLPCWIEQVEISDYKIHSHPNTPIVSAPSKVCNLHYMDFQDPFLSLCRLVISLFLLLTPWLLPCAWCVRQTLLVAALTKKFLERQNFILQSCIKMAQDGTRLSVLFIQFHILNLPTLIKSSL